MARDSGLASGAILIVESGIEAPDPGHPLIARATPSALTHRKVGVRFFHQPMVRGGSRQASSKPCATNGLKSFALSVASKAPCSMAQAAIRQSGRLRERLPVC